ncbi:MAG TPA: type II secretion system minor pseudopilin GspK [Gammaproteobacteria bacterium]|nr:type II secretion system minor pseudopilin GspK [Gammaproteobacteria bacterium]
MTRDKQRGVAVLVALVVLALAATLSASMLWDRNLDVHRTGNILHLDQAREYLLGARAWSEQILQRDAQQSQTDSLGEKWATQIPALPVQGGGLIGRLVDVQGLFNLNSLIGENGKINAQAVAQFQRLLAVLQIDPSIAMAVADWIDPDMNPTLPAGAEDGYYAGLPLPYLAADQPLTSVSELLLIKGMTYRDYQRLLPYVVALPAANLRININTAPWPVVASLAKGITPAQAQSIVAQRGPNGFQSVAQFQSLLPQRITTGAIGLSSSFFRLVATAKIGSSSLTMYSLLERGQTGAVFCIRQTLGTL